MPVMPPERGRMVCKASLPGTLQDVTKAVKGAATLRQRRWTQHPPCHSTSQHCPDSSPPRDKAVAADRGQALLGSVHGRKVKAPHVGRQPTHGCLWQPAWKQLLHPQSQGWVGLRQALCVLTSFQLMI